MKISFFALIGFLLALSVAAPVTSPEENTAIITKRMPTWEAYFGNTAAEHQTVFNQRSALGYRMISLSVYGTPSSNRYAAVWVQRAGPSWVACHETGAAAYQTFFNKWSALGYVTTIVSVTGSASSPIYAAVMEKNGVNNWYQKCGLSQATFNTELDNAQKTSYILKSFAQYGGSTFCGVWHINSQFDKYTTFTALSYANYQTRFNSEVTKPYWRPSYLAVSEEHAITATFTDTDVGSWVARHGMDAASMQAEYVTQKAAGRYIIHLQGGGTGSNARFAAIFADHDIPTARTWRTTGTVTGFQNNAGFQTSSDSLIDAWMKKNGIRQAQMSVAKAGKILMEKGYSWSEGNRHTVVPADRFLLASNSKMFVPAAIKTLIDSGVLALSTKVYPKLGITSTLDPRLQLVTVDMLIRHYGGTDGYDVTYKSREVSLAYGQSGPPTMKMVVELMAQKMLVYQPDTVYAYSNYGYLLLTYLIEKVTGQTYYDYLKTKVLTPGSYDVQPYETKASSHVNDPITQESKGTGPSPLTPLSNFEVADIFGGDGMYKEIANGPASLECSASTLARFIGTHAVWGIGGRVVAARYGSTPGTETCAVSRGDGLDFAITINTRDFPTYATKQEPFFNILCEQTIPTFLNSVALA